MSTATLQIRVEDSLKEQAVALFERLGLDLPTAIRIFLKKSVSENGVPFEIKEKPRVSTSGLEALYALNAEAVRNGRAGMTEEEIEAENMKHFPDCPFAVTPAQLKEKLSL